MLSRPLEIKRRSYAGKNGQLIHALVVHAVEVENIVAIEDIDHTGN